MTLLTGETDIFSAVGEGGHSAVAFLARRQVTSHERPWLASGIMRTLEALATEGWILSVRAMLGRAAPDFATALDAGFAHAIDVAGVFEAPSISAALEGTVRLEQAGWARLFATEWLIGPREFAAVNGIGDPIERPWGFLAFWEWNDAWAAATPKQRREYDAECDVAFKGDVALNIDIAGRHRLDWAHSWHHLGAWEAPSPEAVDEAITGHEAAADFKFTTSRHVIGRIRSIESILNAS